MRNHRYFIIKVAMSVGSFTLAAFFLYELSNLFLINFISVIGKTEVKSVQVPFPSIVSLKTSMPQVIWRACRGRSALTSTWTRSTHQAPEPNPTLLSSRLAESDRRKDKDSLTIRESLELQIRDLCMITRGIGFRHRTWTRSLSQPRIIKVTTMGSARGVKTLPESLMDKQLVRPCNQ